MADPEAEVAAPHLGTIGGVLEDVRLANSVGRVRPGEVRRQRGEHDDATLADRGRHGIGVVLEDLPPQRLDVVVPQRAHAMEPAHHVRAAVVERGVGERHPAGEVLLGRDERVPVVLVPREPARLLGLLVHGLVVVEPGVGPDEVVAQVGEHLVGSERPGRLVGLHGEERERDGALLGDREAAVLSPARNSSARASNAPPVAAITSARVRRR